MRNKRTIYGIILLIVCIIELSGFVYWRRIEHAFADWNLIDGYQSGNIAELGICLIFSLLLLLLVIVIIWQLKYEKALRCFNKIAFFCIFPQLYLSLTFLSFLEDLPDIVLHHDKSLLKLYFPSTLFLDICLVVLFFIFMRKLKKENRQFDEVRLSWQSFYRKRIPILASAIVLAGIIAVPFIKYEYYERSPYYYRVDEEGYTPASYLTNYIIYGTGILQQTDSYYRCDYWGNYKIGWVFKAKKAGDVTLTVQQYYKGGDIEKRIYTIHVDRDKKIEVTGMREIRIEKKY